MPEITREQLAAIALMGWGIGTNPQRDQTKVEVVLEDADAVLTALGMPCPRSEAEKSVVALREALDEIAACCWALRSGGPAPEDLNDLHDALSRATDIASQALGESDDG